MGGFNSWRVSTRMQLLIGLTLVGLLILCISALLQLKGSMLEDRKEKTKNLIEVSMGVLEYHQKLAQSGKLSEDEAKQAAKESLRNVRFGANDYYFILDTNHVYVLLPPRTEFEGQNKRDMKDANGKLLIQDIVANAVKGGGFLEYWFPRAGQQKAEPKLAYTTLFKPWGWVIGTGIYIDDIDTQFRRTAMVLGGISALLIEHAEQINRASNEVSTAANQQADATSAMAAAIEELTVSSTHIADSARDTEKDSHESMSQASEGSGRVMQATEAIQKIASTVMDASERIRALEGRAVQISSIANVIKDIAGQTNLLALNAAIEAARAGEQGRGFAVVADEVRKLAERTSNATTEIEQMIAGIQNDTVGAVGAMNEALPEVEQGVQLARSASDSLQAIEHGAGRTLERVREVAAATQEQGAASTSIAQRVEQIAQMVEETTATIRSTADTAVELEHIAQDLQTQMGRFRV